MASHVKSRWADDEEDTALDKQRKRQKEEKKKARAEKSREIDAVENSRKLDALRAAELSAEVTAGDNAINGGVGRPSKRRKISPEQSASAKLLRFPSLEWGPCRHVDNFEKLNHIEEGSYGWVSRAKEITTGEIVALKKLKMDNSNDGFPVTGLREIQTLMASRHTNVVALREVVIGDGLEE